MIHVAAAGFAGAPWEHVDGVALFDGEPHPGRGFVGVGWCHLPDKESLGADLYIEDDPAMLDRLMDLGLPVLVRRHAYNTAQCERAEQSGLGLAFEDWADVPEMAEQLIGGSR